jgi:outer membrane protein OmpA-like peptidoglycan-associated protein
MLFFDLGKVDISPAGEKTIAAFVDAFQKARDGRVQVVGHTDSAEASVVLSRARAVAVKMRLMGSGIPPDRIVDVGNGDDRPLVATPPGKREPQNRRVELVLT